MVSPQRPEKESQCLRVVNQNHLKLSADLGARYRDQVAHHGVVVDQILKIQINIKLEAHTKGNTT